MNDIAFVTDGPWDLYDYLALECRRKHIELLPVFSRWVNIKWTFAEFYETNMSGIKKMFAKINMRFVGRQHSGLVDANNIARLALRLIKDDCRLELNDGGAPDVAVRFDRGVGITYVRPCDKVCARCGNLVFEGFQICAHCNGRKLKTVSMRNDYDLDCDV